MYEKGITLIPEKLQRFLRTTALRDNIREANVAAVVVINGELIISDRGLPATAVNGSGIRGALSRLLDDLRISGRRRITYIGYHDCHGIRQYNFGIEGRPARIRSMFRKTAMERALGELGKSEVKAVVAALRKKAV